MKLVGITTSNIKPFEAEIQIVDKSLKLGQFVQAMVDGRHHLCKLIDLQYKEKGKGSNKKVLYLGKISPVLLLPRPFEPDTQVFRAGPKLIRKTLGIDDCEDKIVLGYLLNSKIEVCLNPEGLMKHLAIMGMTGFGKTYTSKVIVEQLIMMGLTTIIIDPHDDFSHLRTNAKLKRRIKVLEFGRSMPDLKDFYQPKKCVILSLKKLDSDHMKEFTIGYIIQSLLTNAKAGKLKPFILIVDEAHLFVPQIGSSRVKTSIIKATKEGRKFGMGVMLLTQRPASISKDALSQCATQIILKVVNNNDIRAIASSVESVSLQDKKQLQKLDTGEALVMGVGLKTPIYVKIKTMETKEKKKSRFGVSNG